ncbi:peptidase E [Actinomadura chibensis]|uniref:Peptidase E n=1 Tax=Actinomadura chibensis TaxID=392828 RepID=A0A5D0NIS7_9ACTN|nr:peptidase E [Actinomadura chibensis]TYB44249.1 peptidase E [Actinomadura chibensis]
MPVDIPTIVATSMGFRRRGAAWTPGPVFPFLFELSGAAASPRLCFIATAGGDQASTIDRFYQAFSGNEIQASHLALFDKPNVEDVRAHLLAQDVIWVDRGSLVNLVAVWRAHGLDEALRESWEAGVVLAGESAGSLCWHEAGTTDSFGPEVRPAAGLGFLPYGNAVHYEHRREDFQSRVAAGELPPVSFATDAGTGLVYQNTELVEVISDRKNARAYRIERQADGGVAETALEPRRLR